MKVDPLMKQFVDLRQQLVVTEKEVIRLKGHLRWDSEVSNDLYEEYEAAVSRREILEEELYALSLELRAMKIVRRGKIDNVVPLFRRTR